MQQEKKYLLGASPVEKKYLLQSEPCSGLVDCPSPFIGPSAWGCKKSHIEIWEFSGVSPTHPPTNSVLPQSPKLTGSSLLLLLLHISCSFLFWSVFPKERESQNCPVVVPKAMAFCQTGNRSKIMPVQGNYGIKSKCSGKNVTADKNGSLGLDRKVGSKYGNTRHSYFLADQLVSILTWVPAGNLLMTAVYDSSSSVQQLVPLQRVCENSETPNSLSSTTVKLQTPYQVLQSPNSLSSTTISKLPFKYYSLQTPYQALQSPNSLSSTTVSKLPIKCFSLQTPYQALQSPNFPIKYYGLQTPYQVLQSPNSLSSTVDPECYRKQQGTANSKLPQVQ